MRADFIPLFTALFVTVHLAQSEIMHISWPTAPTVPENNRSYLTTVCYTELTSEHLDKPILVNHTVYDWRRPCLIRIPTKTEVVFTLARTDPRSSLRVVAGNSEGSQPIATPKLHRMPNSDLTLPVYVGCRYATIVFRPYSVDDYLLFIVRPARDNLIAEENEEVCAGESGKDRNRRSEQNFVFDQQ